MITNLSAPAANRLNELLSPMPTYDFVPPERMKRLQARQLESKEYVAVLGQEDAVKMNYVPQMLEALAMEHIPKVKAICSLLRLSEFKPYVKRLVQGMENYAEGMIRIYGVAIADYQALIGIFLERMAHHRDVMWNSLTFAAHRSLPSRRADLAAHIAIIHGLIDAAEEYSKKYDRRLHDALQRPVYRSQILGAAAIASACSDIENHLGYKFKLTPVEQLNFEVIITQASLLAVELINDELTLS